MRIGNFIWFWVGTVMLVVSTQPVRAMDLVECGVVVMQTIRALRLGVPSKPTAPETEDHPIELEDLAPDFHFVRSGFSVYLLERHSQVRLYFSSGVLTAKVEVGGLGTGAFYSEKIALNSSQEALFSHLFTTLNLMTLSESEQKLLNEVFSERVCKTLFEASRNDLNRVGGPNNEPDFKINGSFVWRLPDVDPKWVGFQVEGWINPEGELVFIRGGSQSRWAILRMIVGKGLVEIRALPTDSLTPGYRFIRVPQARLMNSFGHFESNLERFAIDHYSDALEKGQLVNGDHFPYHHRHITRAMETGLDPGNNYQPLSYRGRFVTIVNGSFQGKRAMVLDETEPTLSPNAGYRRELKLSIEGIPITLNLFTPSVVPIEDEPMEAGINPVTRLPFEFDDGEELIVRGSGERAKVVEEHKGRGPVRHYLVEYLTGPLKSHREIRSTGELVPLKYLPPAQERAP